MKYIRTLVIPLSILTAAFACNNQQSKKVKSTATVIKKEKIDIPIIKGPDKLVTKEFKKCEDLVKEILITSPRYKEITKGLSDAVIQNGGRSFGVSLEGSPDPKKDKEISFSETYDFTVYEIYADRRLNTARFSFNPVNKNLYEYDAVKDQLDKIEFDRNILLKFDVICK
jgi:hypothetical protein